MSIDSSIGKNDDVTNTVTSPSPDVVQTMANLRLSQNRGLDAVQYILDAYSRMKIGCEALAELVGLGRGENGDITNPSNQTNNFEGEDDKAKELTDEALQAVNGLPGFEFRCQSAKILLECASVLDQQSKEAEDIVSGNNEMEVRNRMGTEQRVSCVEAAIQVLGSLLAENDEVVEIWYLLGCAFASCTPSNSDAAKYYWESAVEMLLKVKEGMEQEVSGLSDENEGKEDGKKELKDVMEKIEEVKQRILNLEDVPYTTMDLC